MARKSYEEKLDDCTNPVLKKLFKIIIDKQSNLCIAVDFSTLKETLDFIDHVGKYVCVIKTHCVHFEDEENEIEALRQLSAKKKEFNFLLFEDLKISETGNSTKKEFSKYVKYVDLITVIPICDDGLYKAIDHAIKDAALPEDEPRGVLAVVEFSFVKASKNLWKPLTRMWIQEAARNSGVCAGIIAQDAKLPTNCQLIKATPGIHMHQTTDGRGQNWKPPAQAINDGADIIIVGRGIVASPENELEKVTSEYKEAAWQAYLDDLQRNANPSMLVNLFGSLKSFIYQKSC